MALREMPRFSFLLAGCVAVLGAIVPVQAAAQSQTPRPARLPLDQTADGQSRALPADTLRACPVSGVRLLDGTFHSSVVDGTRHYRIFLPGNYDAVAARYPVIYYFHGYSDRYTLEDYDGGSDTVPKICRFVAAHPVIVVAVDGYVAQYYTGFYGGDPYDIRKRNDGGIDFGRYFLEQVHVIDTRYRTLTTRRYRGVSGLSMGGFMSLYLSARYPQLIGSCSAFNPGPEFFVGEPGRRSLWRPKDFVLALEHTRVRLVHASGDYISQYTEETEAAFADTPSVNFEYRQDEYHRHWATSIGETFDFHMRAFADPSLDEVPQHFYYASAYDRFTAWGYQVQANIAGPAIVYLRHVHAGGMAVETRRWAPDGPAATCTKIEVTTAPRYQPGAGYSILDWSLRANDASREEAVADPQGRLRIGTDCSGHVFGFTGPGISPSAPVLLPLTTSDGLRVMPGRALPMPIRLWNGNATPLKHLRVQLTSAYPTVEIERGSATVTAIASGKTADLTGAFQVKFIAGNGGFARVRLQLDATADGVPPLHTYFDVMVAPANLAPAASMAILDGRTQTFSIFRQNPHGGGEGVSRTVSEGEGNGNGILQPGERATVWVRLPQGLDPFDKGNWCRTKVYTDSPWITETRDIQEKKATEWTGARNRTSEIALNPKTPPGTKIHAILDCEAYSFTFTPDVRYGTLPLYQPFQLHRHYLFLWDWTTGAR